MNSFSKYTTLSLVLTFLSLTLVAQEVPATGVSRDPQAVAVIAQSVQAMGGAAPADLVATGKIELVEGSKTEAGSIRLKMRGSDQSREEIATADSQRSTVLSKGQGLETKGDTQSRVSLELAFSSEATSIPLFSLAGALANPEVAFEYVGLENLGGISAHHVRYRHTFASRPKLAALAEVSAKDVWIDANSFLPVRLSYDRRAARGAADRIPVELLFADYRSVNGLLIPFAIAKSLNGTPWATITFDTVMINVGLTENDFAVR